MSGANIEPSKVDKVEASVLRQMFYRHAKEIICKEQVRRVLVAVLAMIKAGEFDKVN